MLVTAGPSGGKTGEVGVGKFLGKIKTTSAGLSLSTIFGSGLA